MNKKTKFLIIIFIISIFMLIFFLFWGDAYDLMGFTNSTFATGIILFGFSWLIFASNFGVFDIAVYGTRKLWLVVFGKQDKIAKTYFEYTSAKEKVAKYIYLYVGFIGIIYFSISMLLLYVYYQ